MNARSVFKFLISLVSESLTKLMPWNDEIEEQIIAGALHIIDEQVETRGGWDAIDVYVEGRMTELGKSLTRKGKLLKKIKLRYDPQTLLEKL